MKRTAITTAFALAAMLGAARAPTTAAAERLAGHEVGGGNVVGGGLAATIAGGGDDMVVMYGQAGAGDGSVGWSQAGRTARFVATDGDGPRIEYAAPTSTRTTGREAWLVGGGDDVQVVYSRPR
jgi:hypothetical protein